MVQLVNYSIIKLSFYIPEFSRSAYNSEKRAGILCPGCSLFRFPGITPDERRVKHKCAIIDLSPGNAMKPEYAGRVFGKDGNGADDDRLRAEYPGVGG
jgi:hypothetical protein